MDIGHDPVVITNASRAATAAGAAIKGTELTNNIIVTNLKDGWLIVKFFVLRLITD